MPSRTQNRLGLRLGVKQILQILLNILQLFEEFYKPPPERAHRTQKVYKYRPGLPGPSRSRPSSRPGPQRGK